jgi:hypothetical protein
VRTFVFNISATPILIVRATRLIELPGMPQEIKCESLGVSASYKEHNMARKPSGNHVPRYSGINVSRFGKSGLTLESPASCKDFSE